MLILYWTILLKPGNIMLTARGAKLVDFGLARWREQADDFSAGVVAGKAASLTMTGMLLGTPQYMAPEQIARGEVDARTDIFALGAVLFEMAHRQKAFPGETSTEVIEVIRKGDLPPVSRRKSAVPAALDHVIRRCLKSAPAERWQSAAELLKELERVAQRQRLRRWLAWAGAAVLFLALAATAAFLFRGRAASGPAAFYSSAGTSAPSAAHGRLATLAPGQELVVKFTAVPNSADLLFLYSNTPLAITGSPAITASLFDGATLLGTYMQTASTLLHVSFESLNSRFASPSKVGPLPTRVDFSSINKGRVAGTVVVTVAGGTVSLDLNRISFYDAIGIDSLQHRIAGNLKKTTPPAILTPEVPQVRLGEFPIPTPHSEPRGIAPGPDGALWFAEYGGRRIGRITTAGAMTEYIVPSDDADPADIVAGPGGALWFTEGCGNRIGRIGTAGAIREFPLTNFYCLANIAAGPDGALWFASYGSGDIGRITTSGLIRKYVPLTPGAPSDLVAGPDGAIWFCEYGSNKIGRITTGGAMTEYPVPALNAGPVGIVAAPDGALWFAEGSGTGIMGRANMIGRVTTAGAFSFYALAAGTGPYGITAGPDGALWFTEWQNSAIGRLSAGVIHEYPIPGKSGPDRITVGPDGALWFTEKTGNKIGRLALMSRQ